MSTGNGKCTQWWVICFWKIAENVFFSREFVLVYTFDQNLREYCMNEAFWRRVRSVNLDTESVGSRGRVSRPTWLFIILMKLVNGWLERREGKGKGYCVMCAHHNRMSDAARNAKKRRPKYTFCSTLAAGNALDWWLCNEKWHVNSSVVSDYKMFHEFWLKTHLEAFFFRNSCML